MGLTGGFGTLVGGYVDGLRFGIWGKHDPFTNYSVGSFQQMSAHFDRAQNAVVYISPSFSGLTLIAGQTTHTLGNEGAGLPGVWAGGSGNKGDTRLTALGFAYANGPLTLDGSYEFANQVKEPGNDKRLYVVDLAATYNFDLAKVHVILDKIQGDENSALGYLEGLNNAGVNKRHHKRNVMLGITVPLNAKTNLMASYGHAKDKVNDDADASKWAIGTTYALSKRTGLYAAYTKINNDSNAGYAVNPMGNSAGACLGNEHAAVTCGGYGTKGVAIGMKHSF